MTQVFSVKFKYFFFLLFLLVCGTYSVSGQTNSEIENQAVKYGRLMKLLQSFYVDTVNINQLTEDAIVKVLSELDPHSIYISKEEVQKMNEPLEGSFDGIGISFNIYQDTLLILSTIPGGPSEKAGIVSGDRIVQVNNENIAGIGLKTTDIVKLLRGKKGSTVKLTIDRYLEKKPLVFEVTRDKIPLYSLDASYKIDKETGYIKLNRFSATTVEEFGEAIHKLNKDDNLKNLILDLRGNGGGYLRAATGIADQFLSSGRMIVYTEGIHNPKKEYKTHLNGAFEKGQLVVLIDEGSASASEIVSGAIQDWDRGLILGRRSFGKGLVQQPYHLGDGSIIRLTTAHYFTPSGRNIQKSYSEGVKNYRNDYLHRYKQGELFNKDSIKIDKCRVHETLVSHRKVYGGGGIIPDIFVPIDTSSSYKYVNQLIRRNILYPYVVSYLNKNKKKLKANYSDIDSFLLKYKVTDKMLKNLTDLADEKGVEKDQETFEDSKIIFEKHIKGLIAKDLFGPQAYYRVLNKNDNMILKAIELFSSENVFSEKL